MMHEDEAIAILEQQLSTAEGWLPHFQNGDDIDETGLAITLAALSVLAQYWAGRDLVPKRAISALLPLNVPIWPYRHKHSLGQQEQLEDLGLQLTMAKDKLYENALPPGYVEGDWKVGEWEHWCKDLQIDLALDDYEVALNTLYGQLGGGFGMLINMRTIDYTFRDGGVKVETTMRRLRRAFALVQKRWLGNPDFPRCLVMAFTNIQFCALNGISHVREKANIPRVYAIIDELTALVRACLVS